MINPQSLDLSALPSVPLSDRKSLPAQTGIYFAIDSFNSVQYIGSATGEKGFNQRWTRYHHRCEDLMNCDGVRIAYMAIDAPKKLVLEMEEALIAWFNPPLNRMKATWDIPKRKANNSLVENVLPPKPDLTNGIYLSFGEWLRFTRSRLHIPQPLIAIRLDVKVQTISNWENDKVAPNLTPEQTRIICELLQVDLDGLAKAFRGEVSISMTHDRPSPPLRPTIFG